MRITDDDQDVVDAVLLVHPSRKPRAVGREPWAIVVGPIPKKPARQLHRGGPHDLNDGDAADPGRADQGCDGFLTCIVVHERFSNDFS